jgi:tRNA 2-thiocytidine biosynthesis protein TtcA
MSTPIPLPMPLLRKAAHERQRLAKRLRHQVGRAIADYGMIEDGDRVMVCLSGGKDSYTMLDILLQLQKKAPVRFELHAVNLDQKQPGFPEHVLPDYLAGLGVPYRSSSRTPTRWSSAWCPRARPCARCARACAAARCTSSPPEQGYTKIALGHHRDDLVSTFFLNLFFHAKLAAMPPKLLSDDGRTW